MYISDLLSKAPIFIGDPGKDALLITDVECFAERLSRSLFRLDNQLVKIKEARIEDA